MPNKSEKQNDRISILKERHQGEVQNSAPKVYFTCHKKDVEKYFDRICNDIFECCDRRCIIYFKEDMNLEIPDDEIACLEGMNLVVVPITKNLLSEANPSMREVQYALEKKKEVLPFMTDPALSPIYEHSCLGMIQWISPYSYDRSAIPYKTKLRTFLNDIFLDDDTINKIKEEFTARIFFSYRKKDREAAKKLMSSIHGVKKLRDVAIWYDEYLPLAQDFAANIDLEIQKSNAVVFLVTANLLEKGNYVIETEYPIAKDHSKTMFPIQAEGHEGIDHRSLKGAFDDDFPACSSVEEVACTMVIFDKDENDPIHRYLIGLAYLNGVDMEINKERAIEMITYSAEAEYHEMTRPALELLIKIYNSEYGYDDKLAVVYKRMCDYLSDTLGPDHTEVFDYQVKLAFCYDRIGESEKARSLMSSVYERKCELFGESSPSTIRTLCAKLQLYTNDEDVFDDMEAEARCKLDQIKDIDDVDVTRALNNYAGALGDLYGYSAFSVYEEIQEWIVKFRGEGSPEELSILSDLSDMYYELEFYEDAIKVGTRFYSYLKDEYGETDKYTLAVYENLAKVYLFNGDYDEAMRRLEKLVEIYSRYEEEPSKIAEIYYNMSICSYLRKDTDNAIKNAQKAYDLCVDSDSINDDFVNGVYSLLSKLQSGYKSGILFYRWREIWGAMM